MRVARFFSLILFHRLHALFCRIIRNLLFDFLIKRRNFVFNFVLLHYAIYTRVTLHTSATIYDRNFNRALQQAAKEREKKKTCADCAAVYF